MDKPKKGRSIWLRLGLGVFISLLAVFAVLKFVNLEDLKVALATVSWKFILIIVILDIVGLFVRGKAWQTILGNKISLIQSFFGVSEGYFLNNILPFRGGEFGRSFFVGRSSGLGTFYTLSTIVIERAFDPSLFPRSGTLLRGFLPSENHLNSFSVSFGLQSVGRFGRSSIITP